MGNREWGMGKAGACGCCSTDSLFPIPHSRSFNHTARVATTGGTFDARRAGTNTAA
jgi:hypothetical protein